MCGEPYEEPEPKSQQILKDGYIHIGAIVPDIADYEIQAMQAITQIFQTLDLGNEERRRIASWLLSRATNA